MGKIVYADNAATTSVSPEVLEAMLPFFKENYGNPSSIYKLGRDAASTVRSARERIASVLGCKPREIYFTASGSESDNWAIKGAAHANVKKGKHIISTKFEHHAVLQSLESLEKEGFEVTLLNLDNKGLLTAEDVEKAIRPDTSLITIMYANNEVGTILPIKEIAEVARKHKVLFHTDAVQAFGNIPLDVGQLGVDMLSVSGHKIHAPKGIGLLYVKAGTKVANLIDGGGQENNKRGGTENTAYIAGFAAAVEKAAANVGKMQEVKKLRDKLIDGILKIPYTRINGDLEKRLPGNVNATFEFIEGESLLLWLDMNGIYVSTGSACSSASLEPSHVLLAIGVPVEIAHGSLRFTFGTDNTDEDVDIILEKLPGIVEKLRAMSPLYEGVR